MRVSECRREQAKQGQRPVLFVSSLPMAKVEQAKAINSVHFWTKQQETLSGGANTTTRTETHLETRLARLFVETSSGHQKQRREAKLTATTATTKAIIRVLLLIVGFSFAAPSWVGREEAEADLGFYFTIMKVEEEEIWLALLFVTIKEMTRKLSCWKLQVR